MGNHGSKTHPTPHTQHTQKARVVTVNEQNSPLALDSKLVITAQTPISESSVRKQRSPRETPDLYVYASYRNWELAKKQIELNRGLEYVSTNRRFSVLHVAVENNAPVEVVQMILAKGMDPNVVDTLFTQSPLHIVMKVLDERNAFQMMKALVEANANVNAKAKYGRTPLYCAIKYRVPERTIVYLLQSGAIVQREELIFAREKSTREIALLIERVSIMTCLCSSRYFNFKSGSHRNQTNLGTLPTELLRELQRYLYLPS